MGKKIYEDCMKVRINWEVIGMQRYSTSVVGTNHVTQAKVTFSRINYKLLLHV